ncbi:unnamed protein product [Rotaria sordida]|uniref:3-ketoacyl-[acyl-carrier-protein] reductase beta subunit n=1 Tax=Rotaria sordida TaxID=392033 RepID=A0A815DCF9_9BILA|nr:unnamed protein product [Rotaria sordida]CAF4088959.1 unnamed protein product [Rotaria sordida]
MGKLDGKIALITGGSEGIGFATAQQFVIAGAYVFITGRRQELLDAAVKQIDDKHVTGIQADSAKLDDIDNVIKIIKEKKGKLDILFVNAATGTLESIESITEESFDRQFNLNVKSVLFTVQKALPIFVDGGSIILNGSNCSIKGIGGASIYNATKASIRSFARCWSVDLKEQTIRVNTRSPGATETPMLRRIGPTPEASETIINSIIAGSIMGRIGHPSEIGKAALFLASDDSSYVTGIELFVDGGLAQI